MCAHSSVRDLVVLALRLRRNNFFRRLVNQPSITLHSGVRPRTFENRNDLVRTVDWINGVKTGHTLDAGYVLVGAGPGWRAALPDALTIGVHTFGVTALSRGEVHGGSPAVAAGAVAATSVSTLALVRARRVGVVGE